MITEPEEIKGLKLEAADGTEVGHVDAIYVDTESGRPEWVGLKAESPEPRLRLVPLSDVEQTSGALHVPYPADRVRGVPLFEVGRQLSAQDEATLYAHYGIEYDPSHAPMGSPVARPAAGLGTGPGEQDPASRLRMYWP